jgi:tetratricopeptide (TPR) repeat protein
MTCRGRSPLPAALAVLFLLPVAAASAALVLPDDARARLEAMAHYDAGTRAMSSERYAEAADEFEQAVKLDPLLVLAHYGLGQARMALKDYPAAVRAYVGCRKAFHDDVATDLQRDAGREQRLDAQIRAIEDQLAILSSGRPASGFSRPLSTLNPTTLQLQLDTLRVQRKRSSTAAQPTPPWISVALGGAYFRQGAFADAEREYKAAVEADAGVGEAHNNLAVVYLLTKRPDDADREIALAEKAGFKVRDGLKQDVQRLRASQAPAP